MEQADADAVRGRIQGTLDYKDFADCDLVIEAITEDLAKKLEMWKEMDAVVKDGAVLRHQHLVARGDRSGGIDGARRTASSACTSSTRCR